MRNLARTFPFSPLALCAGAVGALAVIYVALIAVVMSYAVLTVGFTQSVKNDESAVALLESQYLASIARIEATDYSTIGYVTPQMKTFVPATSMTALR